MPSTNRPLGDSQSRTHWGAPKRCRSLSLSDEAWDLLTQLAAVKGINRSEVFERLIRKATELT
jgi:hypothetical protein